MIERVFEINAPVATVYKVISDLKAYPEFLSTTDFVEVKREGDETFAKFKINVIKEISYTLRFCFDPPHGLAWDFVRGDLMKDNRGFWKLEDLGDGRTRATYGIDVKFGWMVPKTIVNTLTELQLPELLDSFKKRSENLR
ncbi:MAG: cyclase [Deltaproteobacteria bacterium CG11_big_fil_rev_8_21_14_0_20_45_16]|nr:MAG: cyclase [Deltaproteobacteria bacterium CG11_big_fil_rev_8_21_14_0_20_45_16]